MQSSEIERNSLADLIYNINEENFGSVAMEIWKYQYRNNGFYHSYCDLLGIQPDKIKNVSQIPFLPIEMFRQHDIKTGDWPAEVVFKSSGTTGSVQSRNHIRSLSWYHEITEKCFNSFFNSPADYIWFGLLPSYLERSDSSLIDMVNSFMQLNKSTENKFFPVLNNEITESLSVLRAANKPVVLLGVSFALLDLFEKTKVPVWENLLVMETGGMKGRRMELTREELYSRIRNHHPDVRIVSEYGMTELTSQAYKKDLHFKPGPTMKVYTRDISDPLNLIEHGQRGALNIIDLGNLDTCAFISTDDVGITYPDGSFDVMGRLDQSDIRGCNLMYA
jgi:phenylacetate-coenzyme A ligase PaaK-like adenylate-forming protein